MSVDTVARGMALRSQDSTKLATEISSTQVPSDVYRIHTSGYSVIGKGAATYVNDSQATSALATAHPRLCKQSADGRYWRLLAEDGLNVMAAGALGDGVTNDTAAIQAVINYVAGLATGGVVFFPAGTYLVTEINMTLIAQSFDKTVKLRGLGRNVSIIAPFASGNVLLNLMGSNQCHVEGLHFVSGAFQSQCAIFMARTTVSGNCNNNNFRDVYIDGNYSKACVVLNGSESSRWWNCRFNNGNATAKNRCLWSGGGSLVGGVQAITTVNGGTVSNSGNPNTDNRMFGCEFYAP